MKRGIEHVVLNDEESLIKRIKGAQKSEIQIQFEALILNLLAQWSQNSDNQKLASERLKDFLEQVPANSLNWDNYLDPIADRSINPLKSLLSLSNSFPWIRETLNKWAKYFQESVKWNTILSELINEARNDEWSRELLKNLVNNGVTLRWIQRFGNDDRPRWLVLLEYAKTMAWAEALIIDLIKQNVPINWCGDFVTFISLPEKIRKEVYLNASPDFWNSRNYSERSDRETYFFGLCRYPMVGDTNLIELSLPVLPADLNFCCYHVGNYDKATDLYLSYKACHALNILLEKNQYEIACLLVLLYPQMTEEGMNAQAKNLFEFVKSEWDKVQHFKTLSDDSKSFVKRLPVELNTMICHTYLGPILSHFKEYQEKNILNPVARCFRSIMSKLGMLTENQEEISYQVSNETYQKILPLILNRMEELHAQQAAALPQP